MNITFNLTKKWLISFFSASMMMSTFQAQSAVLNFDSFKSGSASYSGLKWGDKWMSYKTSGSTNTVLVNKDGQNSYRGWKRDADNWYYNAALDITSDQDFDFTGVKLARIGNVTSSKVEIRGYDASGKLVGSTGQVSISNSLAFMAANFKNVRTLRFWHNRLHSNYQAGGYFIMDEFTASGRGIISDSIAEVPIPAAALLFAPALVGFMGLRRKIKASA